MKYHKFCNLIILCTEYAILNKHDDDNILQQKITESLLLYFGATAGARTVVHALFLLLHSMHASMHHLLAQAACVLACAMRSLAIVITIVQSLSFFFSLRLLILTHFGESPMCENLFPPIFWHN